MHIRMSKGCRGCVCISVQVTSASQLSRRETTVCIWALADPIFCITQKYLMSAYLISSLRSNRGHFACMLVR